MKPERSRAAILALGSVNADFQVRVDRWPEPGETLLAREFMMVGGGKSANVAFFARRLELPAMLIARVGDDHLAEVALAALRRIGVDLAHTREVRDAPTGVAMISVRSDGDKAILLAPNANLEWQQSDAHVAVSAIESAPEGSVLVANLEICTSVVERALAAARARGFKVVLDPSPADRMTPELYARADLITPNRSEARQLSGHALDTEEDAERAAANLNERGAGAVLLKLGSRGCLVRSREGSRRLKPVAGDTVDTTGAGDAFAAAAAVGLLEERDLVDTALLAMAASSIAVETYGSQAAYPDRARLDGRYRELAQANRS